MHCGNSSYFSPSLEFSRKVQFYVFLNVNTLYHWFSEKAPGTNSGVCKHSPGGPKTGFFQSLCFLNVTFDWVINEQSTTFRRLSPVYAEREASFPSLSSCLPVSFRKGNRRQPFLGFPWQPRRGAWAWGVGVGVYFVKNLNGTHFMFNIYTGFTVHVIVSA